MAFRWSINPYRGCVHSCHYCFARRYHGFFDLNADEDFTSVIFAKVNAPEVLRLELSRRSWKREQVALGTAADPYQPIEGRYRITRGILEALRDFRTTVGLITKGTLVVRDTDVLSAFSRRAPATVNISVTTMDRGLWRKMEPGKPPPGKRLESIKRLTEAGVNAGVLLAPIVPGITASLENLEEVVHAAARHNARFVSAAVLYLKEGVKEHFQRFLMQSYPHLLPPIPPHVSRRLHPKGLLPPGPRARRRAPAALWHPTPSHERRGLPAAGRRTAACPRAVNAGF